MTTPHDPDRSTDEPAAPVYSTRRAALAAERAAVAAARGPRVAVRTEQHARVAEPIEQVAAVTAQAGAPQRAEVPAGALPPRSRDGHAPAVVGPAAAAAPVPSAPHPDGRIRRVPRRAVALAPATSTGAPVATSPRNAPALSDPGTAERAPTGSSGLLRLGRALRLPTVARRVRTTRRTRAGRVGRSGAVAAAAAVALFAASALPAHATSGTDASVATAIIAPTVRTQDYAVTAAVTTAGATRDGFTVKVAPAPKAPTVVSDSGAAVRSPFPTKVRMSSGFGYRIAPCGACSSMHQGLDFNPGMGASIGAVASGTVRSVGWNGAWGFTVILDHEIDGREVSTLYAHMIPGSSPLVAGQEVEAGELVGKVGSSGVSTGAHLHLEVWMDGSLPVDPAAWLEQQTGEPL